MIRIRFAPSPTGKLHIGSARTALFNYLFAKQNKGKFILRIEDTDRSRSTKDFEKDIVDGLTWLNLDWDEFYKQTDRLNIYKKYSEKLLKEKKAYFCYCTPQELDKERQEQSEKRMAPRYSGRCKNLSAEQIEKFEKEGRKKAIRFKVDPKIIEFRDLIHGKIRFDTSLESDFIIVKSDGLPIFHFAVVVDDAEMKISHVIRGEDHISNTPKQILIQEALGFQRQIYAHIPLILNPDKTKMSKRYGATDIAEYKKMGYFPEAMVNFLALLGWSPGEKEIYPIDELISKFSIEHVQKNPAIFYKEKLDWVNGEWIRKMDIKELKKHISDFGYPKIDERITAIIQERIKRLDEVPFWTDFFFKDIKYDQKSLIKDLGAQKTKEILGNVLAEFEKIVFKSDILETKAKELSQKSGIKPREFFYPLRIAITGKNISPPLFQSIEILGKEKSLLRIRGAIKKL